MIIIFDVDKSTAVIKPHIKPENVQILPLNYDYEGHEKSDDGDEAMVVSHGVDHHLHHYLGLLFKRKVRKYVHPLFGYEDEQIMVQRTKQAKEFGLHTIVIDSISGLGEAIRLALIKDSRFPTMTKDLWGKYATRLSIVTNKIRDLPINVIVTCHVDYKDDEVGLSTHFPAVKGGQKTDMLRWFDVIVYHVVLEDGSIMWQVQRDENKPFIRSRVPIPEWKNEKFVKPDFGPIYKAYGDHAIKQLILGDSGTGKTTALLTIPHKLSHGKKKTEQGAGNSDDIITSDEPGGDG